MVKSATRSREVSDVAFYTIFGLFTYFIWCDLSFFGEIGAEKGEVIAHNYTFITRYTIKLRMLDHFGQYLYLPFCTWTNQYFRISDISWMSANVVTGIHFCVAIVSGRLFACGTLFFRRIGVIAFEFRSMLDIMDGVIYRAQSKSNAVLSGWGTWGYTIDGVADTLGSLFLAAGILYRFHKNPPWNPNASRKPEDKYKVTSSDLDSAQKRLTSDDSSFYEMGDIAGLKRYSRTNVNLTMLFLAFSVGLRGILWDHFLRSYHSLLGVVRTDISPEKQLEVLHYGSTWFSLWLWKFNNADAFLTGTLLALFFDKVWKWMRLWLYATIPNLVVVGLICNFHLMYIRSCLDISNQY